MDKLIRQLAEGKDDDVRRRRGAYEWNLLQILGLNLCRYANVIHPNYGRASAGILGMGDLGQGLESRLKK